MIADILPRLEKVKRTGRANWLACCPAHEDKHPSMTIHETDDGRILVHCHAECSFEAIANAVGLGWDVWFPPKPVDYTPPVKRPFPAADVLAAVQWECQLVAVAACNVANGVELSAEDKARLLVAHQRITEARRLALGER